MTNFDAVGDFHRKFNLPTTRHDRKSELVDQETFDYRVKFLTEELIELKDSYEAGDLAGVADALADLIYVAYGTAHFFGIPLDDVFAAVQQANMAKVPHTPDDEGHKRGEKETITKPAGWTPPDVAGVLMRHGTKLPPERWCKIVEVDGEQVLFWAGGDPENEGKLIIHQVTQPMDGAVVVDASASNLPQDFAMRMVGQVGEDHARKIVSMVAQTIAQATTVQPMVRPSETRRLTMTRNTYKTRED
jgi:predicted HAD superfamily Cof-like phosphohydrolase